MRFAPLFALLLLPLAAFGRDTAYQALRAVGTERDKSLLNHVIEVKGRSGTPQPAVWTIVLDDALARGGVRELEVSNGHIVSERTPVKAYSGSAEGISMNFQKLNLDSEGAFTVAEDEAKRAKLGFDAVDYVLQCDGAGASPKWVLELLDGQQRSIGTITIAADTGAVLAKNFGNGNTAPITAPKRVVHSGEEDTEAPAQPADTDNLGHKIDKSIHHVGASVEQFFTGHRTFENGYDQ